MAEIISAGELFNERYEEVKRTRTKYEHQEKVSRWTDRIVTICEYVLGGIVTAVPALHSQASIAKIDLPLTVGLLGALVITAKIIRERFKPAQALLGARFIVATLTCGIMQVENEKILGTNWEEKKNEEVEFLSCLIGWVEEAEIAGLANVTQIRRPAVKYLPSVPKTSSHRLK